MGCLQVDASVTFQVEKGCLAIDLDEMEELDLRHKEKTIFYNHKDYKASQTYDIIMLTHIDLNNILLLTRYST